MANNYLQFSFAIPNLTPTEEAWVVAQTQMMHDFGENPEDSPRPEYADDNGYFGFEFSVDSAYGGGSKDLWIRAEEGRNPDTAALFVQKFLRDNRPSECAAFTWACTCSTLRADEFDGGAAFITAKRIRFTSGSFWASKQKAAFTKRAAAAAKKKPAKKAKARSKRSK